MYTNIQNLLFKVPDHVTYTDILEDVDLDDIPKERILATEKLLSHHNINIQFKSALLLTNWGNKKAFKYLSNEIPNQKFQDFIPHRLHPYDDTYTHILSAFMGYYAQQADLGFSIKARKDVFLPICKIIEYSSQQSFEISNLFYWLTDYHFDEYIIPLKNHLEIIIQTEHLHGWKPYETLKILQKLDPKYIESLLLRINRNIEDFKLYGY